MRYRTAIRRAVTYAHSRERMAPYAVLFTLSFFALGGLLFISRAVASMEASVAAGLVFMACGAAAVLAYIALEGVIIRNANQYFGGRAESLRKSWDGFRAHYPTFTAVTLSLAVGYFVFITFIPTYGGMLWLFVGVPLFFSYQHGALIKKDYADIVIDSYMQFKGQKAKIFWDWMAYNVLMLLAIFAAAIPAIALVPSVVVYELAFGSVWITYPYLPNMVVGFALFGVIYAYFRVLLGGFKTELYRQLKQ
ncbi:MAG: hypothetical protein ABH829_05060 [archaeon]